MRSCSTSPKLQRGITGEELVKHLVRQWQFVRVRQSGSHIRVRTSDPKPYSVTIPARKPLKIGTLHAIPTEIAAHKGVERDALQEGL